VENSVIIPLFTIIIITLVLTGLDMHDELVLKSVCFQGNMKIEQENLENLNDEKNAYLSDVAAYASQKSMRNTVDVEEVTSCMEKVKVKDNSPRDFIRKRCVFNALRAGK
jgi:hypothetical protein